MIRSRNIPPPEIVSRLMVLRMTLARVYAADNPEAVLEEADSILDTLIEDIKIRDRDGGDQR